jgi:hypothetical protein
MKCVGLPAHFRRPIHLPRAQLSQELEEAAARGQKEVTAAFEEAERELELMRQEGDAEEMAAE